jgi:hypothetical protein
MPATPEAEPRRSGDADLDADPIDDVDPVEGLLDPEKGPNTPASDASAPPPG